MRLHLPKALLAAVLTACLAWPAGAVTSTTTNYPTDSSTPTTFNGDIWTWDNTEGNLSSGSARYTKYSDTNVTYAGDADITDLGKFYSYFFNGSETNYLGNTLRFNGANANKTLTTDWSDYIWIGGIITESGDYTYKLGRNAENKNSNFRLNGANAVNMIINSRFTFFTNDSCRVAVEKGGTWSIAKGKSLTFDTGTTTISSGQNVKVTASGTEGTATLEFTGNINNSGTLTIGSGVNMTVAASKTLNSTTIANNGTITLASGAIIALDQLLATSNFTTTATTTGAHTATNGAFTFATGDGTVSVGDILSCKYNGATATVTWNDGHKTGTASVPYYYIAEGGAATYTEAAANTPAWITVSERATLSGLSGTIATSIQGSGTLSMSAGTGEVTIAAEKLTGFTGDLIVNSGRFNEVDNGHVFSNVTVTEGGQFCINDGYNYIGNVSIAGTGWSNTDDDTWNGALRLGLNSTLSGKLTLTGDACIMAYDGANVTLAGEVDARDRTLTAKGTGTLNFGGNATIGSLITDSVSVAVNGGGTLSILKDSNLQKLHSNGAATITLGDGTNSSITTASRIELSDDRISANTTTLTVSANSVLKITGANNTDDYKTASALLGEWNARTTATINGTLLSEGAALQAGDAGYTLNIETTGLVAAKGIKRAKSDKNPTITVNLKGGSLILGDGGIASNGTYHSATSTGGVIGSYADTTTIASALSLTSGTTTIDTSKYTIDNNANTVTVPTTGATGSDITISGVISGNGALKATGAGKLILSTANTYTGGTTLNSGTIQASNNSALGTGSLTVNGNSGVIVDAANTLSVSSVEVTDNSTLSVSGKLSLTTEHALNIRNNAGVTINGSANLNIGDNKIWGAWGESNAASVISIQKNGSLQHKNFTYSGKENGGSVTINKSYSGGYGCFSIAAEDSAANNVILKYSGSSEATVKAALTDVSITTAANAGKLTVASATKTISKLTAESNVDITNAATLSIADVTIAAGQTVGVFSEATASAAPATDNEGTLTVKNLTANTGSTLNANLVLGGGTLTLNGSLTMGSTLTLNSGITLGGTAWDAWSDKTQGLTLFTSVDNLYIGATEAVVGEEYDASKVFTNGTGYSLKMTGTAGNYNVLLVQSSTPTPEPTTATLSLLALMALAARRRRKA